MSSLSYEDTYLGEEINDSLPAAKQRTGYRSENAKAQRQDALRKCSCLKTRMIGIQASRKSKLLSLVKVQSEAEPRFGLEAKGSP